MMDAGLQLEFSRNGRRTECRLLQQLPPWKVVRGFQRAEGESLVHLGNVSGGIFGGDRLHLCARLERGAHAVLTTSGATRVYRPRTSAPEAVLESEFVLGPDALLEYLPDPLIPFGGARLLQRTSYALDSGASLLAWDVGAPGRVASGEIFRYRQMKLATDIRVCGKPVLQDRLLFEPQRFRPTAPSSLGGFHYMVTFIALRAGMSGAEVRHLEQQLAALADETQTTEGSAREVWASTELPAHGVLVRGLLQLPLRIPNRLQWLWNTARRQICGRTADLPRKTY